MRDAWTAERIELLKKLWVEGETAAAIAGRLGGLSRSAVLGKIFRLRLGVAPPPPISEQNREKQSRAKQTPRSPKTAEIISVALDFAPVRRRARKRVAPAQVPAAPSEFKSLLELRNNNCRPGT
jgi:GcrA cell cycle regulator